MNFFKDLRDSGVFLDDDPLHKEFLKLFFMPGLRKELYSAAKLLSIKKLRVDTNGNVPEGSQKSCMFCLKCM